MKLPEILRFVSRILPLMTLGTVIGPAHADDLDELSRRATRVFEQHCLKCHNDRDRAGELSLTSAEALRNGGQSGSVVEPSKADASLLMTAITPEDGRAEMPQEAPPLNSEDREIIRQWIQEGAVWPGDIRLAPPHEYDPRWWSRQPLLRPPIPLVPTPELSADSNSRASSQGSVHPIDAFIMQRLQQRGWRPAPIAGRRILARRLYYDLIGLPPTPEELEEFEQDNSDGAYERLVERLLASPRYGERWARHWLDVVQYADTHGYDKDQPRPNAWPYRDYVNRSLNEDKAWSRFVQEQIAGDVLFPNTRDGIEALGFLAAGPWDLVGHAEVPETKIDGKIARHLDRDDMVRNTIQSFTSLTVGCAQCHNHKFDPIPQVEYYQLQSVFAALDRADKSYAADVDLQYLNHASSGLVYAGTVHHGDGAFKGTGASGGQPRDIHVLHRGEVTRPLQQVGPGALSIVPGLPPNFNLPVGHSEGDRRAALAMWLTSPDNFFTWRSIVNRVWQHHFGVGLVDTPNDFGQMGGEPSHRELLDWLACEFRDGGQSLKELHRLIVTSQTWQRASDGVLSPEEQTHLEAEDPNNRLLWRTNRRKLDAEVVRDSILAISGKLDLTMGGPGFREFVVEKPEHSPHYRYDLHNFNDENTYRRTIYRFTVRSQLQPLLNALDCADPSQQVAKRNESQSPLQALAMLNNGLILTMARHFADRLQQVAQAGPSDSSSSREIVSVQVARGFLEVTGRQPTDSELELLVDHAVTHGLASTCRILWNLNEFLFID